MNLTQLKAIIVTPCITGIISFAASLTIIISIKQSNIKLTNIYRRLIFLTSFFDIFQSLSQAVSTLPMPKGIIWGAAGNNVSCDLQGFFLVLGACGAMWYSLSLTLYFFLVVVVKIPETQIQKRIEPFLHGFPILYSLIVSITTFALGNYNPSNTVCWVAEEPLGCLDNPDVDCRSKGNTDVLQWVTVGIPVFFVFFANCIMMGLILWNMTRQTKKSQSYRHSWVLEEHKEEEDEEKGCVGGCLKRIKGGWCCCGGDGGNEKAPLSPLTKRLSRPSAASVQRNKEISYRSTAYICGYFATYVFTIIYRLLYMYEVDIPYAVIYIARFTYPLQGFFNILVYTYPHVMSCRRNDSSLSWIKAFWIVVKSGGDSDRQRSGKTNRRGSLRKQKKLLESKKFNMGVTALDLRERHSSTTTPTKKVSLHLQPFSKEEQTMEDAKELITKDDELKVPLSLSFSSEEVKEEIKDEPRIPLPPPVSP